MTRAVSQRAMFWSYVALLAVVETNLIVWLAEKL